MVRGHQRESMLENHQSDVKEVNQLQNDGQEQNIVNTKKQEKNPPLGHAGSPFPHLVTQPITASQPENTEDSSREGCSEESQSYLGCSQPETNRDQQVTN